MKQYSERVRIMLWIRKELAEMGLTLEEGSLLMGKKRTFLQTKPKYTEYEAMLLVTDIRRRQKPVEGKPGNLYNEYMHKLRCEIMKKAAAERKERALSCAGA